MARMSVQIHPGESQTFSELFAERDAANKAITALTLAVCRREGIKAAILIRVEDTSLTLDIPDELDDVAARAEEMGLIRTFKLDRAESSRNGDDLSHDASIPARAESPPAGNPEAGARPVVEPPDVARGV